MYATYTHICIQIHVDIYKFQHVYLSRPAIPHITHSHININTYPRLYMHTHTHIHIHTHTNTHIHTYSDCTCVASLFGKFDSCQKCPANYYCPGGPGSASGETQAIPCPKNTNSGEGSSVCSCAAGFFGDNPNACQLCPANMVTSFSFCSVCCTLFASLYVRVCVCVCMYGFFGDNPNACQVCPSNMVNSFSFCSVCMLFASLYVHVFVCVCTCV
jgi:hypothetical protein